MLLSLPEKRAAVLFINEKIYLLQLQDEHTIYIVLTKHPIMFEMFGLLVAYSSSTCIDFFTTQNIFKNKKD